MEKIEINNYDGNHCQIICGFPGVGKSYIFNNLNVKCLDSDSSEYSWISPGVRNPIFPNNYIKHIQENMHSYDCIFVSTHKDVINMLLLNQIPITIVFPNRDLKDEYIKRYSERGNNESFIKLLDAQWNNFIDDILLHQNDENCNLIQLEEGQYLSDVLDIL